MLFLAAALKLGHLVSPRLECGAITVYRFFATLAIYPLLFAIGVSLTPWDKLIAAVALPNNATVLATVAILIGTGFAAVRLVKLYPIEAAFVNTCHSGQGGTGDVAILAAADRTRLVPFAQIATQIGGAITVTLALILLTRLS